MNDGAYVPLPDVDAYLERIGISQAQGPSLAFLDELIYAHQTHVPFENLDVYEKQLEPSLAIPDLFNKVVERRRGGYCFEMNGLFAALLRALDFDVTPGGARVLMRPDPHPIVSHRVSLVRFEDGLYIADVGFGGPMPGFALRIEDGLTRTGHGQTFTVYAAEDHWWTLCYTNSEGREAPVLKVCTLPYEEADFLALSFFQSQRSMSTFRMQRLANIRTENGSRALTDTTYTERDSGQITTCEITSNSELDQVLCDKFGICDWR